MLFLWWDHNEPSCFLGVADICGSYFHSHQQLYFSYSYQYIYILVFRYIEWKSIMAEDFTIWGRLQCPYTARLIWTLSSLKISEAITLQVQKTHIWLDQADQRLVLYEILKCVISQNLLAYFQSSGPNLLLYIQTLVCPHVIHNSRPLDLS